MLDMHTREKANKIHLDQMHRDANNQRLLRNSNQVRDQENAHTKQWLHLAIAFAATVVFLGSLVIVMNLS
jgi:hypothetical protein